VQQNSGKVGVTFDLWETLIFDKPELDEARGRMRCEGIRDGLERLGISLALDDVKLGYDESAKIFQTVWDQNREVSTVEQIYAIVKLAGGQVDKIPPSTDAIQALVNGYVEPILTLRPSLGDNVVNTLEDLRALGVKIGLISNTGRAPGESLRRLLESYGVMKYFDVAVFSNEVGFRKPDLRIFKQATSELGLNPGGVIHVGDNPDADFNGAKEAGMNAVLFEPELLGVSAWEPNSLFALSRRRTHSLEAIDPASRIRSLRDATYFVKELMSA